jgi:hypothetical protein
MPDLSGLYQDSVSRLLLTLIRTFELNLYRYKMDEEGHSLDERYQDEVLQVAVQVLGGAVYKLNPGDP